MGAKTGLPPALKKFINSRKKKKKPANPNLNPGTKQTEKNRRKKMENKLKEITKKHKLYGTGEPRSTSPITKKIIKNTKKFFGFTDSR